MILVFNFLSGLSADFRYTNYEVNLSIVFLSNRSRLHACNGVNGVKISTTQRCNLLTMTRPDYSPNLIPKTKQS